jgi:hypothetical protein
LRLLKLLLGVSILGLIYIMPAASTTKRSAVSKGSLQLQVTNYHNSCISLLLCIGVIEMIALISIVHILYYSILNPILNL